MKNIRVTFLVLSVVGTLSAAVGSPGGSLAGRPQQLHLVGDSTLFLRPEAAKEGSWGEALGRYLGRDRAIINWSLCGKTAVSIEPSWTNALRWIVRGDAVLFQFGINDSDPKKFVDEATFKRRLGEFVDCVRVRGALPVICSPIAAMGYDRDDPAKAYQPTAQRRVYAGYAKDIAARKQVDFVDMTELTERHLRGVGRDRAQQLFVGDSTMHGKYWYDDTHPTKQGADAFAQLFVAEVRTRQLGLAAWLTRNPKDETAFWQAAIDRVSAQGGGRVIVPPGEHEVGQLRLGSNVELHLSDGAELLGLPGTNHYTQTELSCSEGRWGAVVFAHQVTNVAITGRGMIDGRGGLWLHSGFHPRGVFFAEAKGIRLEDFTFRDAVSWGIVFKRCDGVTVRRLTVDNHANDCNDGIDIEAKNVLIEDCDVDSGDDAICLKSNDPEYVVENVRVTRCVVRSHCNGLKLGTASHGVMRNIRFTDCRAECPRRTYVYRNGNRKGDLCFYWTVTPEFPLGVGNGAINVECVDGGLVEDILFDNVDVYGFRIPIFVRGGARRCRSTGVRPGTHRILRAVTIRNVRGAACSREASTISGAAGCEPAEIALENVDIVCRGDEARAMSTCEPSALYDGFYPDATMFRFLKLPAYGLYIDRAEVKLSNVSFRLCPNDADARPAVYISTAESRARRARLEGFREPLELTDAVAEGNLDARLSERRWDAVYVAVAQRADEKDGAFVGRVCDLVEHVREFAPQAAVFLRRRGSAAAYRKLELTPYGFRAVD